MWSVSAIIVGVIHQLRTALGQGDLVVHLATLSSVEVVAQFVQVQLVEDYREERGREYMIQTTLKTNEVVSL